jgi:hypothetical protein
MKIFLSTLLQPYKTSKIAFFFYLITFFYHVLFSTIDIVFLFLFFFGFISTHEIIIIFLIFHIFNCCYHV